MFAVFGPLAWSKTYEDSWFNHVKPPLLLWLLDPFIGDIRAAHSKGCCESVTSLYLLSPLVQTALRPQMWAGYTCGSRPLKETSTPVGKCWHLSRHRILKKSCVSSSLLGVFLHFCSLLLLSVRNRSKPQERQAGQCSIHSWSDLLGRTGRELIKTHSLYYCLVLWVLTGLKGEHPSHRVLVVSNSHLLRDISLP